MKTMLIRRVNDRVRYYLIELYQNLFGEWMVIRTFGSCRALKPTGVIRNYFLDENDAERSIDMLIQQKEKKGYESLTHQSKEHTCIHF